jgi:uncharacterized Zn finger protein (UPF0148 family)
VTQAEYDALRARGWGLYFCDICRAPAWFTRDDYGELFCVSCGHQAEITPDSKSTHTRRGQLPDSV